MKKLVLITRPEQSAAQTAFAINQLGYASVCEAFLTVVYHDTRLPDLEGYSAVVFTSGNAVEAFALQTDQRGILVYCVGKQTLESVQKAGFTNYQSAYGKVTDLIEMLENEAIEGKILYCRARDVAQSLVVRDKMIDEVVLYHTEKSKEISTNCLDLIQKGAFSHILFYSVRTAESFAELVQKSGAQKCLNQCEALCLGVSMIKCIENLQWKHIAVASTPDRQGMLQLLEKANE